VKLFNALVTNMELHVSERIGCGYLYYYRRVNLLFFSVRRTHIIPCVFFFCSSKALCNRTRFSTVRFSQSVAGSQGAEQSQRMHSNKAWFSAAAAASLSTVAAGSLAYCEANKQEPNMQPAYHKNLKDPMTVYAKYALTKASKEGATNKDQAAADSKPAETEKENEKVFPQATSAVDETLLDPALALVEQPTISANERAIAEKARKAKQHSGGLKIFSGNGNMTLALEIAQNLGIHLGKASVSKFADGECNIVIHENVRGKDVYVIQPTGPPVNDNLMELFLMISTLRRASARRITVVIPYYGYARQDRKMQARVPISAADVARLMESVGVDRVIAVDLHCGQIQGFFGPRVPVDNLDGGVVGLDYFGSKDLHNPVVVSPDAGGVYRAKKFKEGLEQKYDMQNLGLAMIVKQRARAGSVDQMNLVGDVKDCDCIIVDDMIDTAGTICKAADVLIASGARRVFAFASHGLLSGPGNERLAQSKMEEVVILDTLPTSPQRAANEKLTELSVAPLLAQAIFNVHAKKSVSALFK